MSNTSSATTSVKKYRWTFRAAFLTIFVLMLWAELLVHLVEVPLALESGEGRAPYLVGLFFTLLPIGALLSFRWQFVAQFFRSIKVGVATMILIGVGSTVGVLFQQEDVNQPLPKGAVEQLADLGASDPGDGWPRAARHAYSVYQDFRQAQGFFVYHLLDSLGFHDSLGVTDRIDEDAIAKKIANLDKRMPELTSRFGEEFAVALRAQSETGLKTRGKNAEIEEFVLNNDAPWFTVFYWADRLDFNRAYHSDWFAALWAILFFSILSNTFRGGWRRLMRFDKLGFTLSHGGMLLVIVGGLVGRIYEERGILNIHIGEKATTWESWSRERMSFGNHNSAAFQAFPANLFSGEEFSVRLDAFRADPHDVLDVFYVNREYDEEGHVTGVLEEFQLAEQPKHRVYTGQTLHYDWGELDGQQQAYLELIVEEYVPQATISETQPVKILPLQGVDYYDSTPGVIRLRVNANGIETDSFVLAAKDRDHAFVEYVGPNGQKREAYLRFREDISGGMPLEWRSTLSVQNPQGETVGQGEVRVNDYFYHNGYRFFQTNHNPQDPTYSGIGVVYDPGITTVLLGFWAVMIGTLLAFLVNPILKRKHRGI